MVLDKLFDPSESLFFLSNNYTYLHHESSSWIFMIDILNFSLQLKQQNWDFIKINTKKVFFIHNFYILDEKY